MSNYDKKKIAIVEKSSEILAILAGIFLCVSTVFMFTNMLTRTVADFNIRFVYELCGLCAAGTASFAIPYATFKSAHSQMDIITSHLKPKKRALFEGISGICTMVIMLFTVYVLMIYAYQRTLVMETTTTASLPTWIFRWIFAIGMLITTIAAAVEMIDMFRIAAGKDVVRSLEEQNSIEGTESAGEGFVAAFVTPEIETAAEKAVEKDLENTVKADESKDGGEEK